MYKEKRNYLQENVDYLLKKNNLSTFAAGKTGKVGQVLLWRVRTGYTNANTIQLNNLVEIADFFHLKLEEILYIDIEKRDKKKNITNI